MREESVPESGMPGWAYVLAALATLCMLLAWALPVPEGLSMALAALASVMFVIVAIPPIMKLLRKRDPYDLGALRQVHERAGWAEGEETPIDDEADMVCPCCGEVYGRVLPACPSCKRLSG
jgi:hypothetical protein